MPALIKKKTYFLLPPDIRKLKKSYPRQIYITEHYKLSGYKKHKFIFLHNLMVWVQDKGFRTHDVL